MLVLTLYDGEKIHIGDDIEIVIDRCVDDGNGTRLGIVAPDDVVVLREELIGTSLYMDCCTFKDG